MRRKSLLGRVADLAASSIRPRRAKPGRRKHDEIARDLGSRSKREHERTILDAASVQAIRDELDQMSPDALLDCARWLQAGGPPMKPALKELRASKLHEIKQALRFHGEDERNRALDALREFCFNEELRRRSAG
jgi:hypothetical protein